MEQIFDNSNWSLFSQDKPLPPLKFSNGKTQEDIVREVTSLIKKGTKLVCIHGVCGTGKSAIALNIARNIGRTSIVVPVKALQKQYEDDYANKKHVLKTNGKKLKIDMITGRENHQAVIKDATCADPFLPDTIKIVDKNLPLITEYYQDNPYIENHESNPQIKNLKRISVAPANPYWSPIIPAHIEVYMPDARKKKYKGLSNKDFIFYHRKEGCTYYDQYQSYIDADVIMFNSAKYKIETALDRKPATDIEIIDEADEFLDNFSNQQTLNLTRLHAALGMIKTDTEHEAIQSMQDLIKLEVKNKDILGIDEDLIYELHDTKIYKLLQILARSRDLEGEAQLDDTNYVAHALEVARSFSDFLDETYVTFRKDEKDTYVSLVTTNLSKKFLEMIGKNKSIILMSGTLHSPQVLKSIFGIDQAAVIEAETIPPGTIEITKTGKEFDCRYSSFQSKKYTRADYLKALSACVEKAKRPTLVHVNAFEDLPTEKEKIELDLKNLPTRRELMEEQIRDKDNKKVSLFKAKLTDILFSTKCSRGVDFPGDTCNSIIFTKYPNPNPGDIFWKVLKKTHPNEFWDFYMDKARREFLQRIYRALRSENDHVYLLSPDTRVLDAARELQLKK